MPNRDHMLGLAAHGLIEELPRVSRRTSPRPVRDCTEEAKIDEALMQRNRDPRRPVVTVTHTPAAFNQARTTIYGNVKVTGETVCVTASMSVADIRRAFGFPDSLKSP